MVNEQEKLTERFSQAVEYLANPALPMRLGGIEELWHLAKVSSLGDVISVIDILCAFVREPPPLPMDRPEPDTYESGPAAAKDETRATYKLRRDVQSILDRIGRYDVYGARLPFSYRRDLTSANLTGADLTDADLTDADLTDADLTDADLTGANLTRASFRGAIFTGALVNSKTQGLEGLTDDQRKRLIYVDKEPKDPPRRTRRLARAQQGVLAIHGFAFLLGSFKYPNFEIAAEQSLIEEFQSAMEALRDELAGQDDQITALFDTVVALEDETVALKAELRDLRVNAEKAASLGKQCYDEFWLKFSGGLGTSLAIGAGVGVSVSVKYVIGQFGGEIFDLLMGGLGAEGPPVPPPEQTVPV